MSAQQDTDGNDDDGSPGRREVAYRLFAAEFDDADVSYSESDEERAPNYVITPTGARVNRVFVVGVLTEVQPAGEDVLRARIADPTGTFVVYAGQYQPDAQTFLERAEPPAYVAVTGKARTFQPEDSDVVYTSIRPESLNEVDAETRDRWTVGAAQQTLERVGTMATAMDSEASGERLRSQLLDQGVSDGLAAGIPLAQEHYGTTPGYLAAIRELAVSAAEVVADEREEVESLALSPDQGGDADLDALAGTATLQEPESGETPLKSESSSGSASPEPESSSESVGKTATTTEADATADAETTPEEVTESDAETTPEQVTGAEAETTTEQATAGETETAASTSADADEPEAVTDSDSDTAVESSTESQPGDVDTADSEPTEDPAATTSQDSISSNGESGGTGETALEGESTDDESEELGEFDGEFELDADEREEIKSEFGAEFTAGTDVDEPGEAGIETPDPEPESTDAETAPPEDGAEESEATDTPTAEATTEQSEPDEEEVDPEDAVMAAMSALDDGDGAERSAVIDHVTDNHDLSAEAVEDAIQEALMNGRCYEPGDEFLKPI